MPWYRSTTGALSVAGGPDTSARHTNRAEMLRATTDLLYIWTGISRGFGAAAEAQSAARLMTGDNQAYPAGLVHELWQIAAELRRCRSPEAQQAARRRCL